MLIYVLNYISIYIYAIIYNFFIKFKVKKEIVRAVYIVCIIQMILLIALRSRTVGNDMVNYYNTFLSASMGYYYWDLKIEFGYKFLNWAIYKLFGNFQVLIVVMALMTICPVAYFIYKRSKNKMLSLIVYMSFNFYYYTFITLRQSAAYGIILLSYKYIEERKLIKFLLIVLLAFSFHKSALIFLPAYWLFNRKFNYKYIFLGFGCAIMIYVWRSQIASFALSLFYRDYRVVLSSALDFFVLNVAIFIMLYMFRNKVDQLDEGYNMYYMSFFIGSMLMIGTTAFTNMLRITNYFTIVLVVLFPNVLQDLKLGRFKIFANILVYTLLFRLFWFFLGGGEAQMMEYSFFWEQ